MHDRTAWWRQLDSELRGAVPEPTADGLRFVAVYRTTGPILPNIWSIPLVIVTLLRRWRRKVHSVLVAVTDEQIGLFDAAVRDSKWVVQRHIGNVSLSTV